MKPDIERFENARNAAISAHERFNIGTYKERSQHLILKLYYEPDTSCHEIRVAGHVADILNCDGITEIQTSSFGNLVKKLDVFLPDHKVRIVYPCAVRQRVCWADPERGEVVFGNYRSYPKNVYKLLPELLPIKGVLDNENLKIEIVFTSVSDMRLLDGYGPERKLRATKTDKIPDEIIDIASVDKKDDLLKILDLPWGESVSRQELSKLLGMSGRKFWMAQTCLEEMGIISLAGKEGNKKIYKIREVQSHENNQK